MKPGYSLYLTPTITFEDGKTNTGNMGYSVISSDPSVASITGNNLITARKNGTATITYTTDDGGYTASVKIYVDGYGNSVSDAYVYDLQTGMTNSLDAGIEYAGDADVFKFTAPVSGTYRFYSSNSTVITKAALYNANQVVLASDNSGNSNFSINKELSKNDTVYLRVQAYDSSKSGGYKLNITVPATTTGLEITGSKNRTIIAGDTVALSAAVYPSTANQAVNWSSSNSSVATVDSSGVVTGVGSGVAVITARSVDGGYTDTCTITVDDYGGDFYNAAEVTLETGLLKMLPMSFEYSGDIDVFKFKAPAAGRYAIYSTGAEFNVYLTVDNSSYSCIGYSYKTDGSNKAECTVDFAAGEYYYLVLNPADDNSIGGYTLNIAPASGAMDKRYVDISVGGEAVITASENYVSDSLIIFSSSNPAVATVDASGKITGISGGTATVTAKSADGLYSASCTVRVDEYGNDFDYAFEWGNVSYTSINSKTGGVQYGDDRDFLKFSVPVNGNYIVYFTDKNSGMKARLYYEYDGGYNTPSNGLINNPNGNGSMGAFLTTDHEYYLEVFSADNSVCDYEVNIMFCTPVSSVTLNTDAVQLMVDGRYSLIATVFPENAYNKFVRWTSTNSNVVTVSDGGVITGVGSGSALVMVTTEDKGMSYVCEVTVNDYDDTETVLQDGTYRIQNVKSSLYMNGAVSESGVKTFKQEAYSDGNGQVWEIKNTGDGYCTIASAYNPGLYVTATGTNNTNCVLNYASLPSGGVGDAQKWKTVKNPDGTYRIISKEYKGFAIAVFAASSEPHENMVMFEDNQTRNAKWLIIAEERHTLPDGVYTFTNVKSGHALDIHGVTP